VIRSVREATEINTLWGYMTNEGVWSILLLDERHSDEEDSIIELLLPIPSVSELDELPEVDDNWGTSSIGMSLTTKISGTDVSTSETET
jgi:hypothetical protein